MFENTSYCLSQGRRSTAGGVGGAKCFSQDWYLSGPLVVLGQYHFNINHFNTGIHFYLKIWVQVEYFIDIRKDLWRSDD
ncbi:hypothetical protein E2C01_035845 [Portunus trituberculatus]|uniref:Uncharacterized protein n=1 Tax=Portunus trituberculatus TaxID=210409 RepID=A0A5B7FAT9_PORTR|nr:hypothetical protein [Portunus trituberculatus]